jgi:hypothetical protein
MQKVWPYKRGTTVLSKHSYFPPFLVATQQVVGGGEYVFFIVIAFHSGITFLQPCIWCNFDFCNYQDALVTVAVVLLGGRCPLK